MGEHFGGTLEVPGDKSISHRVAILSSLAHDTSTVIGFLQSEDCINTLRALRMLRVESYVDRDGELKISGVGGEFTKPSGPLAFGNSGTGMRLMAGLMAPQNFRVSMEGDASLTRRPMERICRPLELMGSEFTFNGEKYFPPFEVIGSPLTGIEYEMPMASAQVKSCILLAALFADGVSVIHEPRPTRDHTERLIRVLDVPIEVDGLTIRLEGFGPEGPEVETTDWYVPGDFSSAAFWIVSAAARPGVSISIQNVGLNPRRTALLKVLERMGADVTVEVISESDVVEPYGDINVHGAALTGTEIGGNEIPNLIDELPLVAVLGALAEGETVIRDAAELRVKESDRIHAMAENLKRFNVKVEEREDGMTISGPAKLKADGPASSFGDHRIAMATAILATYADAGGTIEDIACTETSYTGFWGDLRHLGANVEF